MLLRLCERFHCLPSQLLAEDARIVSLINTEAWGKEGPDVQG